MHCPKCGQQQISEEVRFCSRCGFLLEGVSRLMAEGGLLPVSLSRRDAPAGDPTAKQKGVRRGSKFVFWSVMIMPLIIALSVLFDSPGPLVISGTLFMIGMLQIIYASLFGEDLLPARRRGRAPAQVSAQQQDVRGALPPSQRAAPVAEPFPPRVTTAEIAQPPASVTEHTTRLLDDK